jgi:hypothetical protein
LSAIRVEGERSESVLLSNRGATGNNKWAGGNGEVMAETKVLLARPTGLEPVTLSFEG